MGVAWGFLFQNPFNRQGGYVSIMFLGCLTWLCIAHSPWMHISFVGTNPIFFGLSVWIGTYSNDIRHRGHHKCRGNPFSKVNIWYFPYIYDISPTYVHKYLDMWMYSNLARYLWTWLNNDWTISSTLIFLTISLSTPWLISNLRHPWSHTSPLQMARCLAHQTFGSILDLWTGS